MCVSKGVDMSKLTLEMEELQKQEDEWKRKEEELRKKEKVHSLQPNISRCYIVHLPRGAEYSVG